MPFNPETIDLATQLGIAAMAKQKFVATAESCTGGLVAASCTETPDSSNWFDSGFVTYTVAAKNRVLGISEALILKHGAVSEPIAREMALGALKKGNADIAVSITGIAGPKGGDITSPLGTVWFGWAVRDKSTDTSVIVQTSMFHLTGDRNEIRMAACNLALSGLISVLDSQQ